MDNRIRRVEVRDRSLAAAEAEVWITVEPERLTPTTELRGRLMGPRCAFANTVEVAYPLRPIPRPPQEPGRLTMRVIIPEASLWEPESPFLYEGPVELWQDGRRCDRITIRHGLRHLKLGGGGLRINGRPLTLRGKELERCSEEEALAFRQAGYNLLAVPVKAETAGLWEMADRIGFLMLGRVTGTSEEILANFANLKGHASCFGWLLSEECLGPSGKVWWHVLQARLDNSFIAVELDRPPVAPFQNSVHFIACPIEKSAAMTQLGLPLILLEPESKSSNTPEDGVGPPSILGRIG
jgi:hypothetical protein